MNNVAIIGPGLLGGSIALALREKKSARVAIWARRQEAADEALDNGFADVASTGLREVVAQADLIIFCTPIGSMPGLAKEIASAVRSDALITDVGSVKGAVVAELGWIFGEQGRFVGSHPMAGSHETGMKAARGDLFQETMCLVTPDEHSEPAAVKEITAFWQSLGAQVRLMTPAEHDEMVALISHLPHLLAATLVNAVAEHNPAAFEVIGPGFRDTTRIASGPSAMWTEILSANRDAVRKSAEAMIAKLIEIVTLLSSDSSHRDFLMNEFLTEAKARRDSLRLPPKNV
jgi:prephenate dehydrogenase